MDRPRNPKVVRTWKVERTKALYEPPRPGKAKSEPGTGRGAGRLRSFGRADRDQFPVDAV
jgi:hypothetical protein